MFVCIYIYYTRNIYIYIIFMFTYLYLNVLCIETIAIPTSFIENRRVFAGSRASRYTGITYTWYEYGWLRMYSRHVQQFLMANLSTIFPAWCPFLFILGMLPMDGQWIVLDVAVIHGISGSCGTELIPQTCRLTGGSVIEAKKLQSQNLMMAKALVSTVKVPNKIDSLNFQFSQFLKSIELLILSLVAPHVFSIFGLWNPQGAAPWAYVRGLHVGCWHAVCCSTGQQVSGGGQPRWGWVTNHQRLGFDIRNNCDQLLFGSTHWVVFQQVFQLIPGSFEYNIYHI